MYTATQIELSRIYSMLELVLRITFVTSRFQEFLTQMAYILMKK